MDPSEIKDEVDKIMAAGGDDDLLADASHILDRLDGYTEDMFDFEGGPMLMVGEEFYGLGTIAGLDSRRKPEDKGIDACVYISIDLNWRTKNEFKIEKMAE